MEKILKQLTKDDRGTSLMELIVAILVVSIVMVALTGMVAISVNQYRVRGAESKLQIEGQAILARLEKIVKSADSLTEASYLDAGSGKYYKTFVLMGDEAEPSEYKAEWYTDDTYDAKVHMNNQTYYYILLLENAYNEENLQTRDSSLQSRIVRYKKVKKGSADEKLDAENKFDLQATVAALDMIGNDDCLFAAYVDQIFFSDLNASNQPGMFYNVRLNLNFGGTTLSMDQNILLRNR